MNTRENLLKRIAAYDFAIVELNLFLDTHSKNSAAKARLNECIEKSNKLKQIFESKYGPLKAANKNRGKWAWISSPWPWETFDKEAK